MWLEQLAVCLPLPTPVRPRPHYLFYDSFCQFFVVFTMSGKDKLEPRLMGIMTGEGVSEATMNKFGDAGVVSMSVFTCLATSREKFVEFIEKAPLNMVSNTVPETIEQAKLIAAWETSRVAKKFEVEAAAQRRVQRLPPQIEDADHTAAVQIFERKGSTCSPSTPLHRRPSSRDFRPRWSRCSRWSS